MNEELREHYSQLFYQIEVSKYFKEILQENINVHMEYLNKLVSGFSFSRKKKTLISKEKAKLNELVHSLKHHTRQLLQLTTELFDIERQITIHKKDLIKDELTINERIRDVDQELDQVTRPISEEIIDDIQEIYNINEALKLCDLINFKHKSRYELSEIYGIHKDVFINEPNQMKLEDLLRDLTCQLSLINKRMEYRRTIHLNTSEAIRDKVSVNTIQSIVLKLLAHLSLLEHEIIELKETRINVIKKYCDE